MESVQNVAAAERGSSDPDGTGGKGGSSSDTPPRNVSDDERHGHIAQAAYRRAHTRNFEPGGELEDWLSAEREVDEGHSKTPQPL